MAIKTSGETHGGFPKLTGRPIIRMGNHRKFRENLLVTPEDSGSPLKSHPKTGQRRALRVMEGGRAKNTPQSKKIAALSIADGNSGTAKGRNIGERRSALDHLGLNSSSWSLPPVFLSLPLVPHSLTLTSSLQPSPVVFPQFPKVDNTLGPPMLSRIVFQSLPQ